MLGVLTLSFVYRATKIINKYKDLSFDLLIIHALAPFRRAWLRLGSLHRKFKRDPSEGPLLLQTDTYLTEEEVNNDVNNIITTIYD